MPLKPHMVRLAARACILTWFAALIGLSAEKLVLGRVPHVDQITDIGLVAAMLGIALSDLYVWAKRKSLG